MNYYKRKKEELRAEAIQFQLEHQEKHLSWWDIADYTQTLEERAKKYGLVKEFKENGILWKRDFILLGF